MAESIVANDKPNIQVKHDWYQTETHVVITVLIKNIKNDDLSINFLENSVNLIVNQSDVNDAIKITYNLSHQIVPDQCSYKLTPSKIEIKLKKTEGIRWTKLEGDGDKHCDQIKTIPQEIQQPQTNRPPSYPTSHKSGTDWSAIERKIKEEEANEKPEGEEALNKLFQEIYGKGSDEVKRAMNKSYSESGGTVLSTNWKEIAIDKVDVKPPDGLEFKKW